MQEQYNKFLELLEAEKSRKNELYASIDEEQQKIDELEAVYREAVTRDDDKKADNVQQEMDKLKRSIKRKQDKIQFIDDGSYNEQLKQQADYVLKESNESIEQLSSEIKKLYEEYNDLRNRLLQKAAEYNEYKRCGQPYKKRMKYIADMFPEWAEQKSEFHNQNALGGIDYSYKPSVYYPTIKGFSDEQVQFIRKDELK